MNARRVSLGLGLAAAVSMLALVGAGGTASAGGGGCHERTNTEGTGTEVSINGNGCFSPTVLRVEPGESVTFENGQDVPHNVAGLSWGMWEKGEDPELTVGETFVSTFSEPGYYPYSCTLHYNMVGLVIVGDPGDGDAAASYAAPEPKGDEAAGNDVAADVSEEGDGSNVSTWAVITGAGVLALGLVGGGVLLRARRR